MWTTEFKRSEGVVVEMTHDFGEQVKVVTDLKEQVVKRYHGGVLVKEYTLDPQVQYYFQFLNIISEEIKAVKEVAHEKS